MLSKIWPSIFRGRMLKGDSAQTVTISLPGNCLLRLEAVAERKAVSLEDCIHDACRAWLGVEEQTASRCDAWLSRDDGQHYAGSFVAYGAPDRRGFLSEFTVWLKEMPGLPLAADECLEVHYHAHQCPMHVRHVEKLRNGFYLTVNRERDPAVVAAERAARPPMVCRLCSATKPATEFVLSGAGNAETAICDACLRAQPVNGRKCECGSFNVVENDPIWGWPTCSCLECGSRFTPQENLRLTKISTYSD